MQSEDIECVSLCVCGIAHRFRVIREILQVKKM